MDPRSPTETLGSILFRRGDDVSAILGCALLAIIGTAVLTAAAKIQVSFWPVPLTMQTFAVLAIGALYGARLGAATVLLYLAEGALGWPVFAQGGGHDYLAGPTGGYLVGYVFAAAIVGWFAERGFDRHWPTAILVFLVGEAAIFGPGLVWLSTFTGFERAIATGLVPFLPGEALKIALVTTLLPLAWRLAGRLGA